MQPHLAAHPAVGASCTDPLRLPGATQAPHLLLRQGPRRADLHALAAEDAIALMVGVIASRDDLAVLAPVPVADGPVDDQLVAGLHASSAEDATAEVTDDEGVDVLDRIDILVSGEEAAVHFVSISQFLKAAVSVCLAEQAVVPARRKKKFRVEPAGLVNPRRVRGDVHFRRDRGGAGRHQRAGPLDLNEADPAGAGGRKALEVTEGRDLDPVIAGCIENELSQFERNRPAVQNECCAGHDILLCETHVSKGESGRCCISIMAYAGNGLIHDRRDVNNFCSRCG